MDLTDALRASFLLAAVAILLAKCVPILSNRFLAYGSREHIKSHQYKHSDQTGSRLVDSLAALRVPHSWFASFYLVSTTCSLLWASQIILKASAFQHVAALSKQHAAYMTLDQVTLTWALMLMQSGRRLFECLALTKPSNARMWIGHWAFGVWFYFSINIAIWIEAVPALLKESHQLEHFSIKAPSLRSFVGVLLFLLASGVQHDCHAYLASLKKYSLPEHPVFHRLVCPHYLAECIIYLALALIAAPPGYLFNPTVFCAFILVAVNLGVTADGTKRWYAQKFGSRSVEDRWRMVPWVY